MGTSVRGCRPKSESPVWGARVDRLPKLKERRKESLDGAASDVLDEALRFAARIAQNGPLAVQAIKRTVRESDGIPIDKAFGIEAREGHALSSTRDAVEGPLAFIEKRPANFEGR